MPFSVIISNNEGGCPATVHATLDDVKMYLRAYMAAGNPALDDDERAEFERDLAALTGDCTESVSGSQAWKETVYVAPIAAQNIAEKMMFSRRDRTDKEVAHELRGWVEQYGLHKDWVIGGERCCAPDELDDAIAHEIKQRREHNSTSMIVTTGNGDSPPGVFLPPAPPID